MRTGRLRMPDVLRGYMGGVEKDFGIKNPGIKLGLCRVSGRLIVAAEDTQDL